MTTEITRSPILLYSRNTSEIRLHTDMSDLEAHIRASFAALDNSPEDLVHTVRKIAEMNRRILENPRGPRWSEQTEPLGTIGGRVFVAYFALRGHYAELLEVSPRLFWRATVRRGDSTSFHVFHFKQLIEKRWAKVLASHRPAVDMHNQGVGFTPIADLSRQG